MKLAFGGLGVKLLLFLLASILLNPITEAQSPGQTTWPKESGRWIVTARWSGGVPTVFQEATVRGTSSVVIPHGSFAVARLDVGTNRGDHSRVELNGGKLLIRQDSLIVGEHTGSDGSFVLNSGSLEDAMDVFVGGATGSTGRMNRSFLTIRGGTFVGLTLTIGEGLGSDSTVSIEGSRANAISALEFVQLVPAADPSGTPGNATLAFTLDEHGVTPITISSRYSGLRLQHDATSHCRLRIALSAVPPRDDVTLVSSRVATRGTFDGLPEGGEITADYAGHTYRWTLTYRGGSSGHDLVLHNRSDYASGTPITHTRPFSSPPPPLWWNHPVFPLAVPTRQPAFLGAEGYGAFTPGGHGGRVLYVDNLNDSGQGSLRAAVEAPGARIVVFRVGGTIPLESALVVRHPFLTLDASSAPAPGITLRRHGIEVHTHDIILRQFRIRIGDQDVHRNDQNIRYAAGDGEYALYFTEGSSNAIADHLSLSWSTNKILSTTKMADLITVQWCILSESLNLDGHGYASIAGGNRVSWHHNLFAHNNSRNPRFQGAVDADFRNNVVYDWGEAAAYGEFDRLNYVGNYLKPGPSTTQKPQLFLEGTESVAPGSLYYSSNILEGNARATQDNWRATGFYYDREQLAASTPFPAPPVTMESPDAAYADVLENAGATAPGRDTIDARIIHEVQTGTGHIIDSVDAAGPSQP
jgi:pectate lyase